MERKELAKKLDTITYQDLGITFDEGLIWESLESRIGNTPLKSQVSRVMAASLFLGILLLPLKNLEKDSGLTQDTLVHQEINVYSNRDIMAAADIELTDVLESIETPFTSHYLIKSKIPALTVAEIIIPEFRRIEISLVKAENIKPHFAIEDLAVIQASLEHATINDQRIEKGRKLSIRAHWESATNNQVTIESNQALKIGLSKSRIKSRE